MCDNNVFLTPLFLTFHLYYLLSKVYVPSIHETIVHPMPAYAIIGVNETDNVTLLNNFHRMTCALFYNDVTYKQILVVIVTDFVNTITIK